MNHSISKELSRSFQFASIIATVLVIAIHYQSKYYIVDTTGMNYFVQEFLTNGLARLAVPYFAFSAGFFFFLKYTGFSSYKLGVKKRISTIFIPYLIASLIMFLAQYFYITILKNNHYPLDANRLIQDLLLVPVSVQLWFLRDLMFLVLISPFIWVISNFAYGIGVGLLGLLWLAEIQVTPLLAGKHVITIETLFFFSLGAWLVRYADQFESVLKAIKPVYKYTLVVCLLFILVLRVANDPFFIVGYAPSDYSYTNLLLYKAAILLGVFVVMLVAYGRQFRLTALLASFTFFVYLYHLLPLSYLVTKLGHLIMPDPYVFYFNFPVAVFFSFTGAYLLSRVMPRLYSIMAGGRGV